MASTWCVSATYQVAHDKMHPFGVGSEKPIRMSNVTFYKRVVVVEGPLDDRSEWPLFMQAGAGVSLRKDLRNK